MAVALELNLNRLGLSIFLPRSVVLSVNPAYSTTTDLHKTAHNSAQSGVDSNQSNPKLRCP